MMRLNDTSLIFRLISIVDCISIHKTCLGNTPAKAGKKSLNHSRYRDYIESGLDNKDYSRKCDAECHEKKG